MRPTLTLLFLLIALHCGAQIQYRYLNNRWCRCLTQDGPQDSDTLVFMTGSGGDSCITQWQSGDLIHTSRLEYTFKEGGEMEVYEENGAMLKPGYSPKVVPISRVDPVTGDTVVEFSTVSISPPGSAATHSISNYILNRRWHSLIITGQPEPMIFWNILTLTKNKMVVRQSWED